MRRWTVMQNRQPNRTARSQTQAVALILSKSGCTCISATVQTRSTPSHHFWSTSILYLSKIYLIPHFSRSFTALTLVHLALAITIVPCSAWSTRSFFMLLASLTNSSLLFLLLRGSCQTILRRNRLNAN